MVLLFAAWKLLGLFKIALFVTKKRPMAQRQNKTSHLKHRKHILVIGRHLNQWRALTGGAFVCALRSAGGGWELRSEEQSSQ